MPPSWTQFAKCAKTAGKYDHLFFPPTETQARREAVDKFCTGCPVRNLCIDLKERTGSIGYWGN